MVSKCFVFSSMRLFVPHLFFLGASEGSALLSTPYTRTLPTNDVGESDLRLGKVGKTVKIGRSLRIMGWGGDGVGCAAWAHLRARPLFASGSRYSDGQVP